MVDGQKVGLCHFSKNYSFLGASQSDTTRILEYNNNGKTIAGPVLAGNALWLKSSWGADGKCQYSYSEDGKSFTAFGEPYLLSWGNYRGDRIGLYSFNSKADEGYVDVNYFHYNSARCSK